MKRSFFSLMLLLPSITFALSWSTLWQRPDQQEARSLMKGNAEYRAKRYESAVEKYSQGESVTADYNRGNALARLGRYQEAMQVYEKVLETDPQHSDAKYNNELIKKLLKNQTPPPPRQNGNSQQKESQPSPKNQQEKQNPQSKKKSNNKPMLSQAPPRRQQNSQLSQDQTDQWLKQVPDDPGGLLRQKFLRDHQRQMEEGR